MLQYRNRIVNSFFVTNLLQACILCAIITVVSHLDYRREVDRIARLAEVRRAHGMTQEQLAAASGVHRVTIARIERGYGNTCTLDTISRLAAALGVTIDELMDRETG